MTTLSLIFCCLTLACLAEGDPQSWPFENPNKFGVADDEFLEPKWLYDTPNGRRVAVFENAVPYKTVFALTIYQYLTNYWRYGSTNDPYSENDATNSNNVPWKSYQDVQKFSNSATGKTIQKLVMQMSGGEKEYQTFAVTDNVVRRGDLVSLYHDSSKEDDEFSAVIYLNEIWKKNYYGETMFYDEDEEIMAVVKPKFGRIVVWDSSIDYLFRPPSISYSQGQRFLHIRYTTNSTKVKDSMARRLEMDKEIEDTTKKIFDHRDKPIEHKIDVKKHLIKEYKSLEGKRIVVLDNLFNKNDLDELRKYTMKYGQYFYDDSLDLDSDNVQWIAGYEVDNYVQSRFWNITKQVMVYVTGSDGWFPYDVSCNFIRNADHTKIHHDCERHEDEWTFLVYLNPNWTENYYGETAYFEKNDDDTEYIAEVLPQYGRAVIHEGIIPHSARPPSSLYPGARLTFAVKMSITEQIARNKIILEKQRHEESIFGTTPILKHFNDDDFEENLIARVVDALKADTRERQQLHQNFEEGHGEEEEEGDDEEDEEGDDHDHGRQDEQFDDEEEFDFYAEEIEEVEERINYLELMKSKYATDMTKLKDLTHEVEQFGEDLRKDFAKKFESLF